MGILDKMKEQAAVASAAAKDAAAKGQSKLDDMQAKKNAESMLRDLGALSYASVAGREGADAEASAQRLVAALQAYEAERGELSLEPESPVGKGPSS
jgi:hypothetical protein